MSKTSAGSRRTPLGDRVRAARARLEWRREDLASHAGLSWSAIEQIESGRRRDVRPDTLDRLGRALGVSIDYLVNGRSQTPMLRHQALIYQDDDSFLAATVPFLVAGLERSEAVLVVTKAQHVSKLRGELGKKANQVDFVESETWYTTPSSALNTYRSYVEDKLDSSLWTRLIGEPIWMGRSETDLRAWHRYESLLNLAFGLMPVTLLCPYDERSLDPTIIQDATLTHPELVEGMSAATNPTYRDPSEFILGDDFN